MGTDRVLPLGGREPVVTAAAARAAKPFSESATTVDAAADMARFVATTSYDQLSPAARQAIGRSIMDTLGIATAGGAMGIGHEQLVSMVGRAGGAAESTVIGYKLKVPSWMAAFANSAMARAMNFDDSHDEGSTHPSSVVVPAALAVAERRGKVDGRSFMTAVAVGNEVICRLGSALARRPGGLPHDGWFLTSVLGVFGATAACCRIFGLDHETTRNAFGIALFEACGTLEAFSASGQSSMMRGMITGLTAKSGVLAASMAEAGITGVPDSFEGRYGLFPVYFDRRFDRDALIEGLGRRWLIEDIGLKAWPTMRYISSYIDAVGQLVCQENIDAADIAEIRVHVAGYVATRCEPLNEQRRPRNYNHAGHALPYLVAAMAVRRRLTIGDLVERLHDPEVLDVAERVVPVSDPEFGADNKLGPAKVVIETRSGTLHGRTLQFMYGDPRNPMTDDDIAGKFRRCIAFRSDPLPAGEIEALVRVLQSMEDVPDVAELARRLS